MKTFCDRCPLYAPKEREHIVCQGITPGDGPHPCPAIDDLIAQLDAELLRRLGRAPNND